MEKRRDGETVNWGKRGRAPRAERRERRTGERAEHLCGKKEAVRGIVYPELNQGERRGEENGVA